MMYKKWIFALVTLAFCVVGAAAYAAAAPADSDIANASSYAGANVSFGQEGSFDYGTDGTRLYETFSEKCRTSGGLISETGRRDASGNMIYQCTRDEAAYEQCTDLLAEDRVNFNRFSNDLATYRAGAEISATEFQGWVANSTNTIDDYLKGRGATLTKTCGMYLDADIASFIQTLETHKNQLADLNNSYLARERQCQQQDAGVGSVVLTSGMPKTIIVNCLANRIEDMEVTVSGDLDKLYREKLGTITNQTRQSWGAARNAAESSRATQSVQVIVAALDQTMNAAIKKFWDDNADRSVTLRYVQDDGSVQSRDEICDANTFPISGDVGITMNGIKCYAYRMNMSDAQHQTNGTTALQPILDEYEAYRRMLLAGLECQRAVAEIQSELRVAWTAAERDGRDVGAVSDPAKRLETLQNTMNMAFATYKSKMAALYASGGPCFGQDYDENADAFLAGIRAAYDALVRELMDLLDAARKRCLDAVKKLQDVLQSDFDYNKKLAKDKRAQADPDLRLASLRVNMAAAMETYVAGMQALYASGGPCFGYGAYDPNTDEFLKGIRRQLDALIAELEHEPKIDYQDPAKLKQLQDAAAAAREKEQSLANRLLGGGSIALSGIGGMQLMQGLAEGRADDVAAAEMRAYQSTFRCGIGDAGVMNIPSDGTARNTPAYSQLALDLKSEYTDLVNDLIATKEAVGMAPGIEAMALLDTSALYTSEAMGMDQGTRFDTAIERDDRNASRTRTVAGAAMLGVGVAGGIVGDILINRDRDAADKSPVGDAAAPSNQTAVNQPRRGQNNMTNAIGGVVGGQGGLGSVLSGITGQSATNNTVQDNATPPPAAAPSPVAPAMTTPVAPALASTVPQNYPTPADTSNVTLFQNACTNNGGRITDAQTYVDAKQEGYSYHADTYTCTFPVDSGKDETFCDNRANFGLENSARVIGGGRAVGEDAQYSCVLHIPYRSTDGKIAGQRYVDYTPDPGDSTSRSVSQVDSRPLSEIDEVTRAARGLGEYNVE